MQTVAHQPPVEDGTVAEPDILIIAASETDANLYYATRFPAPDPFIFLRIKGETILLMSDLEVDRARATATVDTALRSNCLLAVSLGLVTGARAQRCVDAALRYLVVPGALRSLAPVPVSPPLPIYGSDGHLLNNPAEPYQGRYEGDEDTRRKTAYHNGTAWTWTFPVFCEALARAWDF